MWCVRRVSFPLFVALLFFCWDVNAGPSASVKPTTQDLELVEKLKKVFVKVLTEHPNTDLPRINLPESATLQEKAEALATHALNLAGPEVQAWLGENGELMYEVYQALKVKDKKLRSEKVLDAVQELLRKLSGVVKTTQTCKEVKESGMTPEARLGHSPIPLFGFPVFNPENGTTVLERRLPLNKINGHKVGIKVGVGDYMVQGTVRKVLEFLDCFGEYDVTAQTLFPDGHWYSEAQNGLEPRPLYLQIQGTMQGGSVSEVLAREALQRVIRRLDFKLGRKGSLVAIVDEALRGDMTPGEYLKNKGLTAAIMNLRSYARVRADRFLALVKEISEAPTFQAKLEVLHKHLAEEEVGPDGWSQPSAVKHHTRVTLTLTSYPRPDNNNRSTKRMAGPVATLAQVAEAVREIRWER